jgi:hypothetical protein
MRVVPPLGLDGEVTARHVSDSNLIERRVLLDAALP